LFWSSDKATLDFAMAKNSYFYAAKNRTKVWSEANKDLVDYVGDGIFTLKPNILLKFNVDKGDPTDNIKYVDLTNIKDNKPVPKYRQWNYGYS